MIRKCKLLWSNGYWAVVAFEETQVQVPAKAVKDGEVKLRYKEGSFYIVEDKEPVVSTETNIETEENA